MSHEIHPKPYPEADSAMSEQVAKVAEGVTAYAYTPTKKAASAPHRIAGVTVSEEVWRFAAANGLIAHLETAIRLLFESFHKIDIVRFVYEVDPEIENESWIAIRAKVEGRFDELLKEDLAYTKAITRAVPADKRLFIRFIPSGN